ncbi:hypothetical protein ACKU27_11080 [Sphingobium yanoikuyae]
MSGNSGNWIFGAAILLVIAFLAWVQRDKPRSGIATKSAEPRRNPMAGFAFKDGPSFFEAWCKFGDTTLTAKKPIVGLVVDISAEYGIEKPVKRNNDGSQAVVLDIASPDGGFRVYASTASGNNAPLSPGDLVSWIPLRRMPKALFDDKRSRWLGLIVAKHAPEFDDHGIKVLERY